MTTRHHRIRLTVNFVAWALLLAYTSIGFAVQQDDDNSRHDQVCRLVRAAVGAQAVRTKAAVTNPIPAQPTPELEALGSFLNARAIASNEKATEILGRARREC